MSLTVRAELRVDPDTREEFLKVVQLLVNAAAHEDGTLRYDWYSSEDPALFVVIEEYASPEAAIAHNEHCEPLLTRVAGLAEMASVHLHGQLGAALEAWAAEHPSAHAHPPLAWQ
jgi:quinol monooxygenase YgiN